MNNQLSEQRCGVFSRPSRSRLLDFYCSLIDLRAQPWCHRLNRHGAAGAAQYLDCRHAGPGPFFAAVSGDILAGLSRCRYNAIKLGDQVCERAAAAGRGGTADRRRHLTEEDVLPGDAHY